MISIQKIFFGTLAFGCFTSANAAPCRWYLATSISQALAKVQLKQQHIYKHLDGNTNYDHSARASEQARSSNLAQGFECGLSINTSCWVVEIALGMVAFYGNNVSFTNYYDHPLVKEVAFNHKIKIISRYYWFLEGRLGREINKEYVVGVTLGGAYANLHLNRGVKYDSKDIKGAEHTCTYNRPGIITGIFVERYLNDKLSITADAKLHFYKNIKIKYTTNDGECTHSVKITPRIMQFGLRLKYTF